MAKTVKYPLRVKQILTGKKASLEIFFENVLEKSGSELHKTGSLNIARRPGKSDYGHADRKLRV